MDPSDSALAQAALLRRLIGQGIRLIGCYGWTWVDWHELAGVPATVLHDALQGRISDPAGCERLVQCLGWTLPTATTPLTFTLPRARLRPAPMPTCACPRCGARGRLTHAADGADGILLACAGCGEATPLHPTALAAVGAPGGRR